MKLEINITKKQLYYVLGFVVFVFIMGIAIAQSSAPNPGHAATEIGEGTIANALTITAGNIGIGTASPNTKLDVTADDTLAGTDCGQFCISGSTDTRKRLTFGIDTTSDVGFIQPSQNGVRYYNLALNPNGGNVGIGTTNPAAQLELKGTDTIIGLNNINGRHYQLFSTSSGNGDTGGSKFAVRDAGVSGAAGYRMIIDSSGNVGIGTVSPTARLEITSGGNTNPNIQINSAEGRGIKIDKTGGGETLLYLTQNEVYNNAFLEAFGGGETPLLARIDGVGGAYFAGNVIVNSLSGSGNAYACINANGQLYRSATACS